MYYGEINYGNSIRLSEEDRFYWYWLLSVENITCAEIRNLLARYGTPFGVFLYSCEKDYKNNQFNCIEKARRDIDTTRNQYEQLSNRNIRMLLKDDIDFPQGLRSIPDAPYGLFIRGKLPSKETKSVAVIGARKATTHGRVFAEKLAEGLSNYGLNVISGMAEGIDGSAHMGSLAGSGISIAVLGSGIDVCYPRNHSRLYESLIEQGGIISEYAPGVPALPHHFPWRNRIISGLSDVVVVVEARERSGSLITVSTALEQGKEVMAVPARPDDPVSEGCLRLLKEGAGICTCCEDVLEQIEYSFDKDKKEKTKPVYDLTEKEVMVYGYINNEEKHPDEIAGALGLDIITVNSCLMSLEIKGYVTHITNGLYIGHNKKSLHI